MWVAMQLRAVCWNPTKKKKCIYIYIEQTDNNPCGHHPLPLIGTVPVLWAASLGGGGRARLKSSEGQLAPALGE